MKKPAPKINISQMLPMPPALRDLPLDKLEVLEVMEA